MSEPLDPRRVALTVKAVKNKRRRDPLARYGFASDTHRRVAEFFGQGVETHHRAANFGGKTQNLGAIVVALLRDTGKIAGVKLPRFGRPTVGAVLVRSYDGQVDSSQKAILDWLGDHPHQLAWINRGKNVIGTIWVRPDGWRNDDPQSWSRVTFFSQEASSEESIKGQRWDFVAGDEPPTEAFWREARKNAKYRLIGETPIHREQWEWLQKDFDGCLGVPFRGRVELVSTLKDNRFLSPRALAEQEDKYRGDQHYRARMFGEYVDIDGACPFGPQYDRLEQLLRWAEPGSELELDPRIETWRDRDPDESYMVLLDPSAGIRPIGDTPGGDRCGLWVIAFRANAGVARYLGWMPPHELARMGRKAAEYYNTALLVPEVNGIGEAMLPEFEGYPNMFREFALERPDKNISGRAGWYQTEQTKAAAIGSLIRALADGKFDIPSAEAIKSLMAIRQDQRGKLLRPPGQNHEDMMLLGMGTYLLAHPTYQPAVKWTERKPRSLTEQFEQALANGTGRRVRRPVQSVGTDRWR
jgi:hypothetical protein